MVILSILGIYLMVLGVILLIVGVSMILDARIKNEDTIESKK